MPYKVYLKKGEEKRILRGHSWVYANEVLKIEGKDKNGSLAEVYDYSGRYIGKGFINHASKILVRIMIRDARDADRSFFIDRITAAVFYRKKLGFDNSYRAVFGEADGLPALIVDKYGDYLCVQFLGLGMDNNKELIVSCLNEVFSPKGIYERSDVEVRLKEGLPIRKGILSGECPERVTIIENGIKMSVDLDGGQKTGYFLDQKENRFAIRRYCRGARVLDCFSNSGGFSLNAAAGGALLVKALDISEKALADVSENARLNGYDNIIETERADVFKKLREIKKSGEKYDVVILDPPAFCKSASEVKDAYRGYKDINILGMKIVEKGGFLVTSSCSHYMTPVLFEKMLAEAATESGVNAKLTEVRAQSPDHPALIGAEETRYLKFYVFCIN